MRQMERPYVFRRSPSLGRWQPRASEHTKQSTITLPLIGDVEVVALAPLRFNQNFVIGRNVQPHSGINRSSLRSPGYQLAWRRIMSKTIGTAIVALLLLGSVSDAHVASRKSARHHHGYALSVGGTAPQLFTPDVFDRRGSTAPVMRNGGFGCDPDFGPNGYNPCNEPGQ